MSCFVYLLARIEVTDRAKKTKMEKSRQLVITRLSLLFSLHAVPLFFFPQHKKKIAKKSKLEFGSFFFFSFHNIIVILPMGLKEKKRKTVERERDLFGVREEKSS